jgi:hypothetical protein
VPMVARAAGSERRRALQLSRPRRLAMNGDAAEKPARERQPERLNVA